MSLSRLCFALLLCLLVSPCVAPTSGEAARAPSYDWVLVYYMSYDNNLEGAGRPILDMLREGIQSDRVAVVVLADFSDAGMHRYVLTTEGEIETRVEAESSADPAVLAAELRWVRKNFKARRYGITFLNHGGKLGEMSRDDKPAKEDGPKWLYVPDVARVLTEWRASLPGSLEFMFFQQCGKGTLENQYEMRGVAPALMGSQTVVGAPNYYYTPSLQALSGRPDMGGAELLALFTRYETANMFTTYTTVSSTRLEQLPQRLDAVLAPVLALDGLVRLPLPRKEVVTFFQAPDEAFVDLLALLETLYSNHELEVGPLQAFSSWLQGELIVNHRVSPLKEAASAWSGLTVLLPLMPTTLDRYADYQVYSATRLKELLERIRLVKPTPPGDAPVPPSGQP